MRAELEIMQLHAKLNELREHDMVELAAMQQRCLDALQRLQGAPPPAAD